MVQPRSACVVALVLLAACDRSNLSRVCPGVGLTGFVSTSTDTSDHDGDGIGICAGDCDDRNPTTNPLAIEICDNVDNDCDGTIDEDLYRDCWTGPTYVPKNEGKKSTPTFTSFAPESACHRGVSTCVAGSWSSCDDEKFPSDEICNGIDDDCDGQVDETLVGTCGPPTELGVCQRGNQVCSGNETYCLGAIFPQDESCNGVDDNCNGQIDELLARRCQSACGEGIEVCHLGQWEDCDAPVVLQEVCDGVDNDCNGQIDDGVVCECDWSPDAAQRDLKFCSQPPLTCGVGLSECQEDGQWGTCMPYITSAEICNAWDDDCDGDIDGFSEPCGDPEFAGHGVCRIGIHTCTFGGWEECVGSVSPNDEVCNGLDDDCDDMVDEGLNPHERADVFFLVDGSGSMCDRAEALRVGMAAYADEFRGTEQRFGYGIFPGLMGNVDVITPPVAIDAFLASLSSYDCFHDGIEPGWTAALLAMTTTDVLGIGWRSPDPISGLGGAFPYVIVIGDESPDQEISADLQPLPYPTKELDVARLAAACRVGSCGPGDRFETFVLTLPIYFSMWDGPTYFELDRLVNIDPPDGHRYTEIFRGFLRNLCRN